MTKMSVYSTISRISAEINGLDPNPLATFNIPLRGGLVDLPHQWTRLPAVSMELPSVYYGSANMISSQQKGYQQGKALFFDPMRVRADNSRKVGTDGIRSYDVSELKAIATELHITPASKNKQGYVTAINEWLQNNGYQTAP